MFLSIIIPVYNAEKYISECLDSCIHQDIPESDYEIICVNDGSTDHSLQILQKYAAEHDNIILIDQENGGEGAARNAGLCISHGDYCWFVDADDLIKWNCLSELKKASGNKTAEVVLFKSYFFHEVLTVDEKNAISSGTIKSNQTFSGLNNRIIKRDVIGGVLFRAGLPYGADIIFLREIAIVYNIHTVDLESVFHFYRLNDSSITHRKNNYWQRAEGHMKASIVMRDIYNAPGGSCEANANILMNHLWYCMMASANLPQKQAKVIIKQLRANNLFPMHKLPGCTTHSAHVTTRNDLVGRGFNWLCTHSHTEIGYRLMRLYYRIRHFDSK